MTAKLLVLLGLVACRAGGESGPPVAPVKLVDASASLDAVKADFNAHAHEPRLVTLLSAT